MSELSRAEREVYVLLVEGLSNRQIADPLFVAVPTVKAHVTEVLKSTGRHSRAEVIAEHWRAKLWTLERENRQLRRCLPQGIANAGA